MEDDFDTERAEFVDGALDAAVSVVLGAEAGELDLHFWWRREEGCGLEEL